MVVSIVMIGAGSKINVPSVHVCMSSQVVTSIQSLSV